MKFRVDLTVEDLEKIAESDADFIPAIKKVVLAEFSKRHFDHMINATAFNQFREEWIKRVKYTVEAALEDVFVTNPGQYGSVHIKMLDAGKKHVEEIVSSTVKNSVDSIISTNKNFWESKIERMIENIVKEKTIREFQKIADEQLSKMITDKVADAMKDLGSFVKRIDQSKLDQSKG